MAEVCEGSILEWLPDTADEVPPETAPSVLLRERVLWVDETVVICLLFPGKIAKITVPVLRPLGQIQEAIRGQRLCMEKDRDPYAYLRTLPEDYKSRHLASQQKAWHAIREIVRKEPAIYDPSNRGRLIREAAVVHGVTRPALYKWLYRYWVAGKTELALFPDYFRCGHIPEGQQFKKSKTPEDTKLKLWKGLKEFKTRGRSLQKALDEIHQSYFVQGVEATGRKILDIENLPALPVARYYLGRVRRDDLVGALIKEFGKAKFNKRFRPLLHDSRLGVYGPGAVYQIDSTIADVYLVSRYDRQLIIGRPILYFVIDVFTHLIVGLFAGLEGPKWEAGASQALLCAFSPKLPFLRQLGMEELVKETLGVDLTEGIWPAKHICTEVLGDAEILSEKAKAPIIPLNLILSITPSRQPYAKGIVESQFNVSQQHLLTWAPGAVNEWRREVEGRNYKYDALLCLEEFLQVMLVWVLYWNNHHPLENYRRDPKMVTEHIAPIPRELWEWGIANRSGALRQRTREVLELELLPRAEAAVTQEGLLFKGMTYLPRLAEAREQIIRAAFVGVEHVVVSYDSRQVKTVLLHLPGSDGVVTCDLILPKNERYAEYYLEEIEDLLAVEGQAVKTEAATGAQTKADMAVLDQKIIRKAMDERLLDQEQGTLLKAQRGNVAQNRAREVERRAKENGPSILDTYTVQNPAEAEATAPVKMADERLLEILLDEQKGDDVDG